MIHTEQAPETELVPEAEEKGTRRAYETPQVVHRQELEAQALGCLKDDCVPGIS